VFEGNDEAFNVPFVRDFLFEGNDEAHNVPFVKFFQVKKAQFLKKPLKDYTPLIKYAINLCNHKAT